MDLKSKGTTDLEYNIYYRIKTGHRFICNNIVSGGGKRVLCNWLCKGDTGSCVSRQFFSEQQNTLRLVWCPTPQIFTSSKSKRETLQKGVKYVQLITLNIFHTLEMKWKSFWEDSSLTKSIDHLDLATSKTFELKLSTVPRITNWLNSQYKWTFINSLFIFNSQNLWWFEAYVRISSAWTLINVPVNFT